MRFDGICARSIAHKYYFVCANPDIDSARMDDEQRVCCSSRGGIIMFGACVLSNRDSDCVLDNDDDT